MRRGHLLALLCCGSLAAGGAHAGEGVSALGAEGEVYRVLRGTYGELVAGAPEAEAANIVLALERQRPGEAAERLLVPGTDTASVESYPSLTFDRKGNAVYLVWESSEASFRSELHLTSYAAGAWSPVVELTGDPFSIKRNPRVAVTRDAAQVVGAEGTLVDESRIVLHLVWWDEGGPGDRALYMPLVIADGAVAPEWRVISLAELAEVESGGGSTVPGLYRAPQVRASGDGERAVIAFAEPGGRLVTLVVDPVAANLVSFGDEARAQIIDTGRNFTGSRHALADLARAQIIDTGRRLLDAAVAGYLAETFLARIAGSSPNDELEAVAGEARAQIIDTGLRLRAGARATTGAARAQIIDTGRRRNAAAHQSGHLARIAVTGTWLAPWLPDRTIQALVSDGGGEVLLVWDLDSTVRYRQLEGEDWGPARTLTLGDGLTREEAHDLLERRLQQR
jgi:hypothetical protein